jgi:hypothetical protein
MTNRRLAITVAAAALSFHALNAGATVYQGYVTNVTASFGVVYIYVGNGTYGGSQGNCPLGTGMVYSIAVSPTANDFNKTLIAIALSAKSTGLVVYAAGDGVCTNGNPYNGGGSEGLSYLDLKG